jgi:hypothetical protein
LCVIPAPARADELHSFICLSYGNGAVPFEKARQFGLDPLRDLRVEHLEGVLKASQSAHPDSSCVSGAALTLGAIGSDRAVEVLKAFILEGKGQLTEAQYKGKSSAVLALGWAANGSNATGKPNEAAFKFLITNGVDPEFWHRNIQWKSSHPGEQDIPMYLVRRSLQAIGLSGRVEIVPNLSICKSPETPFQAECDDARSFAVLAQKGLSELYP